MPGQPGSSFIPLFLKEGRHTGQAWAPEQETGAERPNQHGRSFVQTRPSMIKAQNQKQKQEKAQPPHQTRLGGDNSAGGGHGPPTARAFHPPRCHTGPTKNTPGQQSSPPNLESISGLCVADPGCLSTRWCPPGTLGAAGKRRPHSEPVYVHCTMGHTSTTCSKLPSHSRTET